MIVGIVLLVVSGLLSSLFYSKKKYIWFLLCLIFALCCFLGFTAAITNILLFQVIMGVTTLGTLGIFAYLVLLNKKGKNPRYNKTIFAITIFALLFAVMGISSPKDFMLHTDEVIAKDKGNHTNSKYFEVLTSKDNWDTENKMFSIDTNSKGKVSLKLKGLRDCTVTIKNSPDFDKDTDQSVKIRKIELRAGETKTLSFVMKNSDYVEIELVIVDPDGKKTYVEFNNEMEDNYLTRIPIPIQIVILMIQMMIVVQNHRAIKLIQKIPMMSLKTTIMKKYLMMIWLDILRNY
ncbi:hypothetical protein HMPREF0527_01311 [Lactobacillus jensenii SJ-7A-US]|uniref:hypothetical protein n=1 Tax=Lactobacillus jensenii TaxID=109790 RepID=UPI0001B96060|nr:hypothetical protein [Lactobacillus jensenii]EEX26937.1 hypothetical protein HMPREF0527_01311 [Lactobacillus jensenii SJ-7A-US]